MAPLDMIILLVFILYASNYITINTINSKIKPGHIKSLSRYSDISGQSLALVIFGSLFYSSESASSTQASVFVATLLIAGMAFCIYAWHACRIGKCYKEFKKDAKTSGHVDIFNEKPVTVEEETDLTFSKNIYLLVGISFSAVMMIAHSISNFITG